MQVSENLKPTGMRNLEFSSIPGVNLRQVFRSGLGKIDSVLTAMIRETIK